MYGALNDKPVVIQYFGDLGVQFVALVIKVGLIAKTIIQLSVFLMTAPFCEEGKRGMRITFGKLMYSCEQSLSLIKDVALSIFSFGIFWKGLSATSSQEDLPYLFVSGDGNYFDCLSKSEVNQASTIGYTPFLRAFYKKDRALMKALYDFGADIEYKLGGETALDQAVNRRDWDMFLFLHGLGAKIRCLDLVWKEAVKSLVHEKKGDQIIRLLYRARLGCVNFNHAASPIEENV